MKLSEKRVGRLSLNLFKKLYQCYKDDFDLEMRLNKANMTYQEAYKKTQKSEEWF